MDFDYTSGLELGVELDPAPNWVAGLLPFGSDQTTMRFDIGQEIYTPRSRGEREIPGERPFAGWLYGAASVHSESKTTIQILRVELGVVGPPALAEETQNGLHNLYGSINISGWENQLPTEPGIEARYDISKRVPLSQEERLSLEVRPNLGIGVGTIWSGTRSGVQLIAASGGFSAFVGTQGEWVWRNEFLDGTAFRESESTPKIPLVGQFAFGAHLRVGQFGANARFVFRSREYDGQPADHAYGSFTTSLHF